MTRPVFILAALAACSQQEDPPDASWDVTVTTDNENVTQDCGEGLPGYEEKFRYDLYFEGSQAVIKIGGEHLATGVVSGCMINYESPIWLDSRDTGDVRWRLSGDAQWQQAGGGCGIDDGWDWLGYETIEVTGSEDPSVPEGCTYELYVTGTFVTSDG